MSTKKNPKQPTSQPLKITVADLLEVRAALIAITPKEVSYYAARHLARVTAGLNPEFIAAETERLRLHKKYGVEKDGSVAVPPEKRPQFYAEYNPFLQTIIEPAVAPLPADILDRLFEGAQKPPQVAPMAIAGLQLIIEKESE